MKGKIYNEKTGKWISGGAAQLHIIKKSGGWENFIGRIVTTNPIEGERYYLRLLLNHIRGPKSFEDLKIVNSVKTLSFLESALLYGL